jgi:hypothetical protein
MQSAALHGLSLNPLLQASNEAAVLTVLQSMNVLFNANFTLVIAGLLTSSGWGQAVFCAPHVLLLSSQTARMGTSP